MKSKRSIKYFPSIIGIIFAVYTAEFLTNYWSSEKAYVILINASFFVYINLIFNENFYFVSFTMI